MLRALTMNAPGESADKVENCTFDGISVGDSASLTRTLTRDDIALFAVMSGDLNPAHLDERYAEASIFHRIIAHGMWGGALVFDCRCVNQHGEEVISELSDRSSLCSVLVPRDLGWASHDGVRSISVLVTNGKQRRCFPCVAIQEPASRL